MRQRCCDSGEHEARDAEHKQHADGEIQAVMARPHQRGHGNDERSPQEIGVDEHLTSTPLVEEDPGEGAHQ